jgi:Arc-like DNA binding dprotein
MKDARNLQAFAIRIPEDLRLWLKHQAVDNYRSLNSEVVIRLEQSRAQQVQQQGSAQ